MPDPNADIWQYSEAASPLPKPKDYTGPNGYFEYLQTVQKKGEHGAAFSYQTINSDTLGWIIARTTGKAVDDLLSERIWQKIGAEQSAYMTVDAKGTPFAGGGISAGLHDMALIGSLMLIKASLMANAVSSSGGRQNRSWGGDKAAFAKADYKQLKNGSYKSMWWSYDNPAPVYSARGVHGQRIYVDPAADMVIVRFASHPDASNGKNDPTSIPAFQAVANYLITK